MQTPGEYPRVIFLLVRRRRDSSEVEREAAD